MFLNGNVICIKEVEDYKYLGAWISSTKKDFSTRKLRRAESSAWDIARIIKLKPLWISRMPCLGLQRLVSSVLTAAVESVLMYGSESWTLTETLTKRLEQTTRARASCSLFLSQRELDARASSAQPLCYADCLLPRLGYFNLILFYCCVLATAYCNFATIKDNKLFYLN